jgi:hypothetical protein
VVAVSFVNPFRIRMPSESFQIISAGLFQTTTEIKNSSVISILARSYQFEHLSISGTEIAYSQSHIGYAAAISFHITGGKISCLCLSDQAAGILKYKGYRENIHQHLAKKIFGHE